MRLGILISSFNRPAYLKECLDSIKRADLPAKTLVLIVDDHSSDEETKRLINTFQIEGVAVVVIVKPERSGIASSVKNGFDFLFNNGCTLVMNLDSDAVVRNDFVGRLTMLHDHFPDRIITGFNCLTKNKDGSERHIVLGSGCFENGVRYNLKRTVGGLNMMFDKGVYEIYVKPKLILAIANGGNWDYLVTKFMFDSGLPTAATIPSVVQHIGIKSSMGHSPAGGEPPDQADDFKYLSLPNVTLVGADCVDINRLIKAADHACKDIEFGEVILLSSLQSNDKRVVPIKHMGTKSDYSEFMMKELAHYISTPYILVIQYDGTVLNAKAWRKEWLNYDYIGAVWEWYEPKGDYNGSVGNGGFSLRTKRLHDILMQDDGIIAINEPGVTRNKEEDHCICRLYRKYLENNYKIRFAPKEEARLFSIEAWGAKEKTWGGQFGFHGRTADISKSGFKF